MFVCLFVTPANHGETCNTAHNKYVKLGHGNVVTCTDGFLYERVCVIINHLGASKQVTVQFNVNMTFKSVYLLVFPHL